VSKNFAMSTVSTAPSPATSGLSLTVAAGTGTRFYAGPAWVWPPSTDPTSANAEVVTIASIATDTLTLSARAVESTSAKAIASGWQIAQGVTAALWDDLTADIAAVEADLDSRAPKTGLYVQGDYGAVGDGIADDTSAIQDAAADAIAQDRPLIFEPGEYVVAETVDLRGHGLQVHANGAVLRMDANNKPIVLLGGTGQVFRGRLRAYYGSQQTTAHTLSNCFEFYAGFNSHYESLVGEAGYNCFFLAQDDWALADVPLVNTLFSCSFHTLRANGFARSGIDFSTWGSASSTGNVILNVYTQNNYGGSTAGCTAAPVILKDLDEGFIGQLNIEHVNPDADQAALELVRARALTVNALHFEGITLTGHAAFIRAFDQIGLVLQSPHVTFCTIDDDGAQKSFLYAGYTGTAPERIRIENLKIRDTTTTGVTAFAAVELYAATTADVEIRGGDTDSFIGPWVVGDTYPEPMVKRVADRDYTARFYTSPADLGYRAWSVDGRTSMNTFEPTAGTVYVQRLRIPERLASGSTLTSVLYVVQAGTGGSPADWYVGFARADTLARIAVSTTQTGAWNSIGGKEVALTTSADKPEGVDVLGIVLAGTQSTTPVGFARGSTLSSTLANGRLANADSLFATSDTGASAIPATLAALTGHGVALWHAAY
jgi:hypothetical protein